MKEFVYNLIPGFLKIGYYKLRGKRPWSLGYTTFKFKLLKEVIHNEELIGAFRDSKPLPEKYGYSLDERVVEYPWVLSKVPRENINLLDAGSALNKKEILSHPVFRNKQITIVNLNPEPNCFWEKNISYVFEDIRQTSFKDNHFDCISCISTLEHVGMDNFIYTKDLKHREERVFDFEKAVIELKRVLKKNGKLLITVPFGKYQNFKWFQQFDSKFVKIIIHAFRPQRYSVNYYKYSKKGWDISNEKASADVKYAKNADADHAAASRAIACIELIK